jgi:hypothetical protein
MFCQSDGGFDGFGGEAAKRRDDVQESEFDSRVAFMRPDFDGMPRLM